MLKKEEDNGFIDILNFIDSHMEGIYELKYDNKIYRMICDSMYEGDNGKEEDEEGYEECFVISFYLVENHAGFQLTYQNLPEKMYYEGVEIFDRKSFKKKGEK